MSLVDPDKMALVKRLFPVLGKHLRKGDCGKVGVIGGSPEYTGAPYFASITPMKIGADLTFVYAHPDAAGVIKSYSPEMIVYPSTDFATNMHSIDRLDALVFGPGLGRQKHTLDLLVDVLNFVKNKQNLCLVIDADGLFYINDCLELFKGCKNNVIITPNHREFARLFTQIGN
uniref:ATP-dependent NAD(P)H-hydrate dehydratase n=1 Tax=Globodera rostochiensis TaxID=31243 RepID=A0A914HTN3_GLORO